MAARDLTKLTSQELGDEITVVSDSLSKLNKRENDIKLPLILTPMKQLRCYEV